MTRLEELRDLLRTHVNAKQGYEDLVDMHRRNIDDLERRIKEEEEKAKMASFSYALDRYKSYGDYHTYISALEKCRPWVIRFSATGDLWIHPMCDKWLPAMFASKSKAKEYVDSLGCGSEWEIVQWEGLNE